MTEFNGNSASMSDGDPVSGLGTGKGQAHDVHALCWIPVSVRLPEECCDVLVMLDIGSMAVTSRDEDGGWDTTDIYPASSCYVTHWMPLPPPPKP